MLKHSQASTTDLLGFSLIAGITCITVLFGALDTSAQQPTKPNKAHIPVHDMGVRQSAGITFQQDSPQTEERCYLETMGTGVA